jgi:hypothetical protein
VAMAGAAAAAVSVKADRRAGEQASGNCTPTNSGVMFPRARLPDWAKAPRKRTSAESHSYRWTDAMIQFPDRYVLQLDTVSVGPIGVQTGGGAPRVDAGAHTVALDSVASFCEVVAGASRTVVVHGGDTADVKFNAAYANPPLSRSPDGTSLSGTGGLTPKHLCAPPS